VAGVRALRPGTEAALIVLGDQPRLATAVVPTLLARASATARPIVAPVYRGEQGNPVLFAAAVFDELRDLAGDEGARRVVRRDPHRVERVAFDLPMPPDVDTPDDYDRLLTP
jgi:molybdenum cofactor cytidylyltransferase